MAEPRAYHGDAAPHDVLDAAEIQRILDATFDSWARSG